MTKHKIFAKNAIYYDKIQDLAKNDIHYDKHKILQRMLFNKT